MTGRVDPSRTPQAPRPTRRHRAPRASDTAADPRAGGDPTAPRPSRQPGPLALAAIVGVLLTGLGVGAALLPPASAGSQAAVRPAATGVAVLGEAAVNGSAEKSPSATSPASATATPSRARTPSPRPTTGRPSPTTTAIGGVTELEDQVATLVNQVRAKAGCAAVHTDERLRTAARGHSADMAAQGYFSHTGKDGSTFVDREARAGYPRAAAGGENIAMGYPTPANVMTAWMNSSGHRANILTCDFKALGVGLAYDSNGAAYWTQDFGRA